MPNRRSDPQFAIWLAAYRMRKPKRIAFAKELLKHRDSWRREAGLLLVKDLPLDGFESEIETALSSRLVRIRMAACSAVAGTKCAKVQERVAQLADSDSSFRVRLWAIQALRVLGDERWRSIVLETEMRRLNTYEWDDWKLLVAFAKGIKPDRRPGATANSLAEQMP